jgi:hypothetical protein
VRALLVLLVLIAWSTGAEAAEPIETVTATLDCGGTHFRALTRSVHDDVVGQDMWAHPAGAHPARRVELRESRFVLRRGVPGLAVLADEVAFWGCAETATTHVLILWYDCPQVLPDDPPRRFCSDSGEWYRYVAMDGSLLDRGFGLGLGLGDTDPREAALRARLGLPPDHEALTFWSLRWPVRIGREGADRAAPMICAEDVHRGLAPWRPGDRRCGLWLDRLVMRRSEPGGARSGFKAAPVRPR